MSIQACLNTFYQMRLKRTLEAGEHGGPLRCSAQHTSRSAHLEERVMSRLLRKEEVFGDISHLESISVGSHLGRP